MAEVRLAFDGEGPALTYEEALGLAAEIADPDFIERYREMKRRLAELERVVAQSLGAPDFPRLTQ